MGNWGGSYDPPDPPLATGLRTFALFHKELSFYQGRVKGLFEGVGAGQQFFEGRFRAPQKASP